MKIYFEIKYYTDRQIIVDILRKNGYDVSTKIKTKISKKFYVVTEVTKKDIVDDSKMSVIFKKLMMKLKLKKT